MRTIGSIVLLLALTAAAIAETQLIHPSYARPEDVEAVVNRVVPKAGVAAVPRQGAVVVNADGDVLQQVQRVIRELDQPNQVIEFEICVTGTQTNASQTLGTGASVQRARPSARTIPPVPTELQQGSGSTSSATQQTIIAMPGSPVELFIGDTQLRDGGPTSPPIEVSAGKKIKIESLRVIEDGKGAEMDVYVENTIPGAGAVVSSGTRVKTAVRLMVGQTQTVATQDESSEGEASTSDASAEKSGGRIQRRRTRVSGSTSGMVTITLRRIR